MKHAGKRILAQCLGAASAAALSIGQVAVAAEPDRLICGFRNVEDLVALPDSPWIIGAGIGDSFFQSGSLHLFNEDTETGRKLLVDLNPQLKAKAPFEACPGPADPERFSAHGLSLADNGDGSHTLYVVNHGGRESIEAFAVTPGKGAPSVSWIGCIISPPNSMPNSIAARKDGSLVLSASSAVDFDVPQFHELAGTDPKALSEGAADMPEAMKYGAVFIWSNAGGWQKVANSALLGNNGIELSADEKWAFVNSWPGASVTRLPLEPGLGKPTEIKLSFHPDNIRRGSNGKFLATGHRATEAEVGACVVANDPHCAIDYRVAEIDPNTFAVVDIFDGTGTRDFGVATIGLRTEDALWIGSVRSDCVAKVDLSEQ